MNYVEMVRDGLIVAGHLSAKEIRELERDGYHIHYAEEIDYRVMPERQKRKVKAVVYNKFGIRVVS